MDLDAGLVQLAGDQLVDHVLDDGHRGAEIGAHGGGGAGELLVGRHQLLERCGVLAAQSGQGLVGVVEVAGRERHPLDRLGGSREAGRHTGADLDHEGGDLQEVDLLLLGDDLLQLLLLLTEALLLGLAGVEDADVELDGVLQLGQQRARRGGVAGRLEDLCLEGADGRRTVLGLALLAALASLVVARWRLDLLVLHRAGRPGAARGGHGRRTHHGIEQRLGRTPADHGVGDRVGVLLVAVAGGAHATLELNAPALLHHVRRLVRRGVQVGLGAEGHIAALGIGARVHAGAGRRRALVGVRADVRDVMRTERTLDLGAERHRVPRAGHTCVRAGMHGVRAAEPLGQLDRPRPDRSSGLLALHGARAELRCHTGAARPALTAVLLTLRLHTLTRHTTAHGRPKCNRSANRKVP